MSSESHHAVVNRQYAGLSSAYLRSAVHAQGADLDLLAELAGGQPDALALDMGCGGGHVSFRLAPLVRQVIACDLSEQMLATVAQEAARRQLGNIVTRQGAAETLDFPPESFDLVASRYSVHHWRHPQAGIGQMARALKRSGRAVFMDVVSPGDALLDTWLQSIELLRDSSHVRDASLGEWQQWLNGAGLRMEQTVGFRLRLEFASWVERMRTPPEQVAAIRALQRQAGSEVTDYFAIADDGSFTVDTALFVAVKI